MTLGTDPESSFSCLFADECSPVVFKSSLRTRFGNMRILRMYSQLSISRCFDALKKLLSQHVGGLNLHIQEYLFLRGWESASLQIP